MNGDSRAYIAMRYHRQRAHGISQVLQSTGGIDEDPATGSAAGPLAGFLHHHGPNSVREKLQVIARRGHGQAFGIIVRVEENGIVVSGSSVLTMEGTLYL